MLRAADALLLGVAIVPGATAPLGKLVLHHLTPFRCLGLAYLAQTWAQRFASPVRAGVLSAVEPLAAVVFGMLWLADSLSARQAVGAAAILAGVAMGEASRRESREGART